MIKLVDLDFEVFLYGLLFTYLCVFLLDLVRAMISLSSTLFSCFHQTVGELKVILAPLTGLNPQDQRLLFSGKEREDNELLHIAGVDGRSRVIVVEDPASRERKYEEMRKHECISRACHAVSLIRQEVDKLAEQVRK